MKENFFTSMLSEQGKVSHKRFISLVCTIVVCFVSIWAAVKYPQYITEVFRGLLIFISVMSGVATVAQVLSIWKGTQEKAQEPPENTVDSK